MADLDWNDPVHVSRDNRQLEGIVAYLGPVDFDVGDDWVGVRLTGASVGLGKNDGSVQGKVYFSCPAQCGLFVKRNLVTQRQLTRLEELRLKRELATSGGGGSTSTTSTSTSANAGDASATMTTPRKLPTTPGVAPGSTLKTPTTATTNTSSTSSGVKKSPAPTTSSSSTATRLEEIRQRRAHLSGRSSTGSLKGLDETKPVMDTSTTTTTTIPPSNNNNNDTTMADVQQQQQQKEEMDALKRQLNEAETKWKASQEANEKLKKLNASKDLELVRLNDKLVAATSTTMGGATRSSPSPPDQSQQELQELQSQLERVTTDLQQVQAESQQQLETTKAQIQSIEIQLAKAQAEAYEWQKRCQEDTQTAAVDATHFKERAKLQAQVASLNRRVEQLEADKMDLEHNVEELALDKEQLLEEKESLEDRYEELKLDSETAQMEAEELKMELEQAKAASELIVTNSAGTTMATSTTATSSSTTTTTTTTSSSSSEGVDAEGGGEESHQAEDMASNLSMQNARLREALIRLREQSAVQQMELSRQLRTAEKKALEAQTHLEELQNLRNLKQELEEQISDLKDMVEQGSAYEVMVEDLSDRVLGLEEELVACQQFIRELEEAADITAEMEEVQSEELKALNRDLEDRESMIRNLEEAIKMQRKREEDFQRTVSNYRSSVETLKQEKKALLELQEGGEGEKSDLVSASQKALARAAQLVQDAAEMRKREAQAAIDRIDSQVRLHLSERLESLLPPSVASAEIASIKGELLLSKVVGKASLSLDGIARSFAKTVRARAWEWRSETGEHDAEEEKVSEPILLSDEQHQIAATMIHQSEVAHVAIDVSGDLLWLLSAGQWPDIVGPDASAELGAIMGHTMNEIDMVLGTVLNTLKEEGSLSPHQSNIVAFKQTVVSTMQTLRSHIEHDGEWLVPMNWKPPALRLFRDASRAKYSSLGCYAAVASALNYNESSGARTPEMIAKSKTLVKALKGLLQKLDKASAEASKSCLRLAALDVQDDNVVTDISGVADRWRAAADDLMNNVFTLMSSESGITAYQLDVCEVGTDEVLRLVSQFAALLRTANLNVAADHRFHPFSPEVGDVWEGVTMLARSIRRKDGDDEDVNYLVRARAIEQSLEQAVEKEPKLALSNAKVASLEKSLSLRSKEIAVQNTRLSELEKLLARTSAQPSPHIKSAELTSSEEINNLKQENRVLSEAMDVLHRQVEEYESEIRFLKDAKSPTKGRAPRRSFAPDTMRERVRSGEDLQSMGFEAHAGAFEAALFRPALQAARRDAAHWKAKATISTLLELPPLHIPMNREEEKTPEFDDMSPIIELSSALANYRTQTASIKVVDLTKSSTISPRAELYSMVMKKASASQQLDEAAASARQWLESRSSRTSPHSGEMGPLFGRVKFAGVDPVKTISTATTLEDLHRIQLHMVR